MAATHVTINVGGIKVHIFGLEILENKQKKFNNVKISACFICHGRLHNCEVHFPQCARLVDSVPVDCSDCLLAIAFDQRNHGSRKVSDIANEAWPKNENHASDMWAIQYGTACDISYLMDVIGIYLDLEIHKWGVCGVSLGGHATLLAMANEPRLYAGVSLIGCGDYLTLMTRRANEMAERIPVPPESEKYINKHLIATVLKHDPVNNTEKFKNRPLLIVGGEKDPLVPPACNNKFINQLALVYAGSNKLQIHIEPNVKHEVNETMWLKCIQWIVKWLVTDPENGVPK